MAKLIEIKDMQFVLSPKSEKESLEKSRDLCEELESGNILFFPTIPFDWPPEDLEFFMNYNSSEDISLHDVKEKTSCDKNDEEKLCRTLKHFSSGINTFLSKVFTPYSSNWQSHEIRFRPKQHCSCRKNKKFHGLLHTDLLPTQSIQGERKLCFYINFHAKESKKWVTADSFSSLVRKFAKTKKQFVTQMENPSFIARFRKKLKDLLQYFGLSFPKHTPYEQFMTKIHRLMQADEKFQNNTEKEIWEFPPLSCWMFFSDSLAHAKLGGDSFLEHSFIVPCDCLLNPEKAPISLLERLSGLVMSEKKEVHLS